MKLEKTNQSESIRVYNWSNRQIDTVTRTLYKGFGGKLYVKYKGNNYPIQVTYFASEGKKYNIWTSER